MNLIAKLQQLLGEFLTQKGIKPEDQKITVEFVSDFSHGDLTTNTAMRYAKRLEVSPRTLAEEIVVFLKNADVKEVAEVSVAGPGFVNITCNSFIFAQTLKDSEENSWGEDKTQEGVHWVTEHTSLNLFKPFHIGHVVNNSVGESLTRLVRLRGAQVTVTSFPSDVSLGIAKSVWSLMRENAEKLSDENVPLKEKLQTLGDAYVKGTKAYKEDDDAQVEIKKILKDLISEDENVPSYKVYKAGKDLSFSYLKEATAKMGTTHDEFIPESVCAKTGMPIVKENIGKVFEESSGAIIFDGEKRGLHTRVFISGEGVATYETKDIGLLAEKFARFSPDKLLLVTDIEQKEYYKVVLEAAGEINKEWKEKTTHVVHGRLRFPEGRLSSRLGNVLLLEDLLEETTAPLIERGLSPEDAQVVAIAAIKYTILKSELGGTIIFDRDKALSFEGDSGPYLQYTYARCLSLLVKTKEAGIETSTERPENLEVSDCERLLYRFSSVASKAAREFAPHQIATYAIELARAYNSWYAANHLLKEENKEIAQYGAALTLTTSRAIKKSLWILGIDTIDRM